MAHFLASVGASMLCLIKRHQNRVFAHQYHMVVSRAQVSTHRVYVFFLKFSADKLPVLIIGATSSGFFCDGYKSTGASFLALFKSIYYFNVGKKKPQE